MAKMGTFFVPTADIVNDLAEPGGDYDNPVLQRRGQMMMPILKHAIERARALNVKIGAGSDTSYGPRSITTLGREIVMLAESGLAPLDALQAATTRNAELLRLEKEVGQVAQGFQADLVVVAGNPLQDIRTVLDPLMVVSNGRIAVDRLSFGR
jgi:imidazolonepropionase-like amidohydrolase